MSEQGPEFTDQTAAPVSPGPVSGAQRIASLDVLRGVAILGILVMNIYAFAMPFAAYSNPMVMGGTDTLNMGTWFFTHIFFDQKFLSIFAVLFGAGIILMTRRAEERGAKSGRIFYRRQFFMILLGLLHGFLIWVGDILFMYALIGMLAYLFRKRSVRTLIIVACLLLPVSGILSLGFGAQMETMAAEAAEIVALQDAGEEVTDKQEKMLAQWQASRSFMMPSDEELQENVAIHKGGYAGIVKNRAPLYLAMSVSATLLLGLWRVLALMLLGMVLMKTGVLSAARSASFYRGMMLTCYGIGLPLTAYSAIDLNAHAFDPLYAFAYGWVPNYVGSLVVALGHIGLVMLLISTGFVQGLLQRFAAVGRLALTNYLMHSVILTTVFYGYGLGLYGEIERFWQMGFVLALIALQLVLSPWWLARYRFGPVEWLWRSLTYWQAQPMTR